MKYLQTFEAKNYTTITICFNGIYETLSKYYGKDFLTTVDTGSEDCAYRVSRKIIIEYFVNKKVEFFCKKIRNKQSFPWSKDYNKIVRGYIKGLTTTNPAITDSDASQTVTLTIGSKDYKAGLNDTITVYSNQTFDSFIITRRFDL